jgi:type IV pilus assembly protein PilC
MERQMLTASKIRRAMMYPAFVVAIAILVFTMLVTVVLPPMVKLFTAFDIALPWTTRSIMSFTQFFGSYKIHILVVIIALSSGVLVLSRVPAGKAFLDRLSLRLPVFGSIIIQRAMGQFCRTASMLLKAGLQLPHVMDVAIQTTSTNQSITGALTEVKNRLVQGEGMSKPMSENDLFPSLMVKMVAMGEQTGNIDSSLGTLADFYETQSNQRVQSLISLIEPALTVIIGIGVAFVLLSIIMPLYSILGSIH